MSDDSTKSKVPVAVLEYEPSGFEQTLMKHKSKLILVGVLAVAGTAGYWGYRLVSEASNKSAAVAFVRANSVQELKEVASKHEGKAGGGDALVLAADKLSADNPNDGIAMLRDFLSKYPDHPLRDLASWRIAEYQTKSGDAAAAEKSYDEVVKAGTPFSSFALLRLGDLKWAAGDTTKAQEYYDLILNNGAMSGSPIRAAAKARVEKGLKAKPPVLVDYKEEPPAPPPGAAPFNAPGAAPFNTPGLLDPTGGPGTGSPASLLPPPILPQLPPTPAPAVEIMPKPEAPPANPAGAPKPAVTPKPVTPPPSGKPAEAPPPVKPADAPKPAAPTKPATEPKPEPAAKPAEAPAANPAEAPKPAPAAPVPANEPKPEPSAAKPAETPAPAEAPKEAPKPEVKPNGK